MQAGDPPGSVSEGGAISDDTHDILDKLDRAEKPLDTSSLPNRRVKELLSAFEKRSQGALEANKSTFTHIRSKQHRLQEELDQALQLLDEQRALYETCLRDKVALLNQLEKQDQRLQQKDEALAALQKQLHAATKPPLISATQQQPASDPVFSLTSEPAEDHPEPEEENTSEPVFAPGSPLEGEMQPEDTDSPSRSHTGQPSVRATKKRRKSHKSSRHRQLAESMEEATRLRERNKDSMNIITDYEKLHSQQNQEIRELQSQILAVIDMAERLEADLSEEKAAHQETRDYCDKLRRSVPTAASRAHSYTSSDMLDHLDHSSEPLVVPNTTKGNALGPSAEPEVTESPGGAKKRRKRFLSKLVRGMSSSKLDEDAKDSVDSPTASPQRAPPITPPHDPGDCIEPKAMSLAQMERELEVLVVLGERLQAEVINERKQHQITRLQLEEQQTRVEELERSLGGSTIGTLFRRSAPKLGLTPEVSTNTSQNDTYSRELKKIEECQLRHVHLLESSFPQPTDMECYELRQGIQSALGLLEVLIGSPPSSPPRVS